MADEEFCCNYLVLKPEEASMLDLVRILRSSEFEKRSFVEISESEKGRGLRRRWLIFISVLGQIILSYLKTPMAWLGSVLEYWLNLPATNGGLTGLILTLLLGKKVKPPNEIPATFISVIGHLDLRVKLDGKITSGDTRYSASLSIMAAKLSYENKAFVQTVITDHWKMKFLGHYKFFNAYQELYSTDAIMFQDTSADPNLIVVAFRGTKPFDADAWRTDIDLSWYELKGVGKIHAGFMKALGLQKTKGWPKEIPQGPAQPPFAYYTLREKLRALLKENEKAKFVVSGHSLGGALAILFAGVLVLHEEERMLERLEGVYTFGQPRVGDGQFGQFMKEKLEEYDVRYRRYVYSNDIVPRLPYDDKTVLYKHFGPSLYYNSCYKGEELEEEPNKNYFSPIWAIPKILNAWWELYRSFIIPYTKGPEYKEGWFFRLIRVFGLVIPGLSAHCPVDYVNLTRIGTDPSSLRLRDAARQPSLKLD